MKLPLHVDNEFGFKPLEVIVRDGEFDSAVKIWKMMVQKEGVLNKYKHRHMGYEKPSVKRRRKASEAANRIFTNNLREAQMASGEWDFKQKKKEEKRLLKQSKRTTKPQDHATSPENNNG